MIDSRETEDRHRYHCDVIASVSLLAWVVIETPIGCPIGILDALIIQVVCTQS